jgi:hypothetical protein
VREPSVAAGWYPDPAAPEGIQNRWWDGLVWTELVQSTHPVAVSETFARRPAEPALSLPIRLRPIATLRITNFIGGFIIAATGIGGVWAGFAIGFSDHQGWIVTYLGAPFALYGTFITFAGFRLGLDLTETEAIVHGYLRTVRIPRSAIGEVSGWPFIIWKNAHGRNRFTPVNALNVYKSGRARPNPAVVAKVDAQVDILRKWVWP